MTKYLRDVLNDDVLHIIYSFSDTYKQYYTNVVLPNLKEKLIERYEEIVWKYLTSLRYPPPRSLLRNHLTCHT